MPTERLQIGAAAVVAMRDHARQAGPVECCGWLVGSASARAVTAAWAADNVACVPRRAFAMAPQAVLDAELTAHAAGLDILGVYHSHPYHDASPSAGDAAMAVPSWFYLIMGNAAGRTQSTRVWRMPHQGGAFAEEPWIAV